MGLNFTVSETFEKAVFRSVYATNAVNFLVDVFTIHLLWSKTPKTADYYKYLIVALQMFSALIDVHVGLLFAPVPLFPLIATYCEGVLCRVEPHICVVLYLFLLLGSQISLNLCIFYRHHAILPDSHPLKMRKSFRILIYSLYVFGMETIALLVLISDHDSGGRSEYLERVSRLRDIQIRWLIQNHPAMLWLTKKDHWVVYDPHSNTRFVIYYVITSIPIQIPLFIFVIYQTFQVLKERVTEMSLKTLAYHKTLVNSLLMQTFCWSLISVAVVFWVASVLSEAVPNYVTTSLFILSQFFPLLNAFTVIITAPTLRLTVLRYIGLKPSIGVRTSTISMSSEIFPSFFWIVSDPFHSTFFGVTGIVSIFTNGLLIFAIVAAKNSDFGHYRCLLFCFGVCDMLTSCMHFIALPKIHMTSVGFWFFPRNEGIFHTEGGVFATILCFVYVATYYQAFLILSYHFVYRARVLSRGPSRFSTLEFRHWFLLGFVVNVLYIGAFMWASWYTFLASDYSSRQIAPIYFIDLYHIGARDPDVGLFLITWKRHNQATGVLEWHTPTVIAMTTVCGLFIGTSAVIVGCIIIIARSIRAPDLAPKTRRMQQQLFRALLIQTGAPCLFSYIPLSTILLFPLTGIDLGALGTVLIMVTALFPSLDALLVVYFIPRLRFAVCRALRIPYEDSSTAQGYSVSYALNKIGPRPQTAQKFSQTTSGNLK